MTGPWRSRIDAGVYIHSGERSAHIPREITDADKHPETALAQRRRLSFGMQQLGSDAGGFGLG